MNKLSCFAVTLGVGSMALLSSCVDDNYDLSDIDTNVRVSVNDLVIPINIDKIELSSILDIKEDDKIQIVNGVYAATESGSFTSDPITINEIHLAAPVVESTANTIYATYPQNAAGKAIPQISYQLASDPSVFTYQTESVSEYIKRIDHIDCELGVTIRLHLPNLSASLKQFHVKDLMLQLPKGLVCTNNIGGKYDTTTGILSVKDYSTSKSDLILNIRATRVTAENNDQFNFNPDSGSLEFDGSLSVKSGYIIITADDLQPSINFNDLPTSTTFGIDYEFSDITVKTFTGDIQYPVDNVNVSDINLDNLPDVLSQPETNIILANPQIFLSINNPLNDTHVYAQAGMTITPVRNGVEGDPCSLDGSGRFDIGRPYSATGQYAFLLSPTAEGAMSFPEFENPLHVPYSSLSRILSGAGLPDVLRISLDHPEMPKQTVTDFRLGADLGSVHGEYRFVAPLQFNEGSSILYSDTETGWNDEDLDKLTIKDLRVKLNITSELPLSCVLTGYPIDVEGNQINNVTIEGANIPANAQNADIDLHITGEIRHLDGIRFEARAIPEDDKVALRPDMSITLNKVRPVVSGYYEKEL